MRESANAGTSSCCDQARTMNAEHSPDPCTQAIKFQGSGISNSIQQTDEPELDESHACRGTSDPNGWKLQTSSAMPRC